MILDTLISDISNEILMKCADKEDNTINQQWRSYPGTIYLSFVSENNVRYFKFQLLTF